jgi:NADH:ubiquinone oxidoreductase subunit E
MIESNERLIDEILRTNKKTKDNLIPLLQQIQEKTGWISKDIIEYLSNALSIHPTEIYGVVTFYKQFRLTPVGENVIQICNGTACHVNGVAEITDEFEHQLKIKCGETTADKKYSLEKVACLGCCSLAPVVMKNKKVYGNLNIKSVKKILNE